MEQSVSPTFFRDADRRQRARLGVQWELQFCLSPQTLLCLQTENLSSQGFYCVAQQRLPAGAYECVLRIPAHAPQDSRQALYLRCQVEVLRVESLGNARFGIAARIRSYHAFTSSLRSRN